MERKLAVILVADIVGYSAQMERDEAGTYARVTARRREVFEPAITRHQGRIFKLVGDGLLAEFGSAVQAVECAIALQSALAERNSDVPEDQRILARIGINLGEVIVEGDDRFGEGVNIAARLEQLAEAGGICVSEKVAREVERKLAFGFESMGERRVKNISEPIHVYRVSADPSQGPRRAAPKRRAPLWWGAVVALLLGLSGVAYGIMQPAPQTGPPTLAVLPFANLSGDADQDYLGPGVANDVITMLSTSPLLRVVSKASSFAIDRMQPVTRIADQLGVDFVVDGGIQRQGDAFRLSAQLVDGRDGSNLWSSRFEQTGTDVLAMQDAMAQKIYATVGGLGGAVPLIEQDRGWAKSGPSMGEYDYHLRGGVIFLGESEDRFRQARRIWQEGLDRFPESGLLRIELALTYFNTGVWDPQGQRDADLATAWRLLDEADAMANPSPMAQWLSHYAKVLLVPFTKGDFAWAVREAEAVHALVPYDPQLTADMAYLMARAGRGQRAVEWAEFAVHSQEEVPEWYRNTLAMAYYAAGRHADALAQWEMISFWEWPVAVSALVRVGKVEEAKRILMWEVINDPSANFAKITMDATGRYPTFAEPLQSMFIEDLKLAGMR